MKPVLAFETSTPRGTVAVGWGRDIMAGSELPVQSRHAATLLPAIQAVLAEAGVAAGELGAVAVGSGPGSFTGVRVAGATARGLVRGLGLPLVPVSTLAAGAASLPPEVRGSAWICVDARGDRLFAARYRVGGGTVPVEEVAPRAMTLPELLEGGVGGLLFAGDGAWRHREWIQGAGGRVVEPPDGLPSAGGILVWVAAGAPAHPDPARWEPDYLKGAGVSLPTR